MNNKQYTIVKCFFNRYGEITRKFHIDLKPMSFKEAQIMKSKMLDPNDWIVEEL